MSQPPLRIGLIGQRFMGRAHSNAWGQAGRFFELPLRPELTSVAARDASELAAFAERWGWSRSTTDWRALVADPGVDLVDIGTPNDMHAEQAIAALEAGKHVACEKPLAGTIDDARRMRDAARESKAKTYVWFNYRRCPAVALAHEWIRSGKLGKVFHVRARYLQGWGGKDTPLYWRFQKDRAGSGAHGDLNAHIVDLARFLLHEEVLEVHGAVARTFVTERKLPDGSGFGVSDVDDCALFLASFTSGATASFEATRLAAGHLNDNGIEINGSKGSLRFDFDDMNTLSVHEEPLGDVSGGWKRIAATAAEHPYAAGFWPDGHWIGYEHTFVNMAADIVRDVAGELPVVPLPDFSDAYETQRVLEAALLSAERRRAVELSEIR
jgi:predicted dehydrogenase